MLISYNSKKIQKICHDTFTAKKELGIDSAKKLRAIHSDLLASEHIFEAPFGTISIDGNLCRLVGTINLTIEMIPNYISTSPDEIYDWETVERIKIIRINNVN